jgi:hypothetical protein
MPRLLPLLILSLACTACGSRDNDPGPGGVSVGEAKALDDAAQMLDARKQQPLPDPHPEASGDMPEAPASPAG